VVHQWRLPAALLYVENKTWGTTSQTTNRLDRIGSDRLIEFEFEFEFEFDNDNCGLFHLEHNKLTILNYSSFLQQSRSGARLVSITQVLFTELVTGRWTSQACIINHHLKRCQDRHFTPAQFLALWSLLSSLIKSQPVPKV
jgi:hypothetical protein